MSRLAILAVVALAACARPLLGPPIDDGSDSGTGDDSSSGDAPDPAPDDAGDTGPSPADDECHPSYSPCLPVVDDLDCPDVVALGLAPVELQGEDAYGLDADGDGIGCEP